MNPNAHPKALDTPEQRQDKIKQLKERGLDPYSAGFTKEDSIHQVLKECFPQEAACQTKEVCIAGRVLGKRPMGKACFLKLSDQNADIQIYSNSQLLSEDDFFILRQIDIGDVIGVRGETFRTKTNEASVRAVAIAILSKNLSPIPIVKEKEGQTYDSFSDVETRYRKRYLDLAVNPKVRQGFAQRSQLIKLMRDFLTDRGFIEVETPMLQSVASGAAARPFETYHNTLGIPLHLRIAPELYLKRLIVGGFEKVFEINRNFRNEGVSTKHNPEFTMMELYQAYSDYKAMITLTQDLFEHIAVSLYNGLEIPYGEHTINLKKPWKEASYLGSIKEYTGIDFSPFLSRKEPTHKEAKEICAGLKLDLSQTNTFWEVVDEIFSQKVEPELIQPTIVTHYPKAVSPLARSIPGDDHLVERFEPYIAGREMGNAFSELNDPIEQEKRFQDQMRMKKEGAQETVPMDHDYIEALRVGMPPTGGLGLGVDRMVMLFNNQPSIKDVILFPTLRPKNPERNL